MEKTAGKISKTAGGREATKKALNTRKEEEEQTKMPMEYKSKKKEEMY
jgi:hypothetical protein